MGPGEVGRPVLGASLSAYSKPAVFLTRRTREQGDRCDEPLQDKPSMDAIAVANALLVSETQHERGIAPSAAAQQRLHHRPARSSRREGHGAPSLPRFDTGVVYTTLMSQRGLNQ
jgi:hypothetical protein